jgi:hypothetical protein
MVTAWVVISLLTGQPLVQKQIRVEPAACHMHAVRAEYPINGEWTAVTLRVKCAR